VDTILYKNFKKLWLSILFIDSIELTLRTWEEVHHSRTNKGASSKLGNALSTNQRACEISLEISEQSKKQVSKSFPRCEEKKLTGEAAIYFKSYFLKVFVQTIGATCRLIDLIRSKDTIPTGTRG